MAAFRDFFSAANIFQMNEPFIAQKINALPPVRAAEERVRRAREAVNALGGTTPGTAYRNKLMSEAVVELQRARAHLRSVINQEETVRPKLTMLKPAVATLGQAERQPWQRSATTPKRITGRVLQRLRAELFRREPACRECARSARIAVATIRDHIVNLAEGGTEDPSNIQPLCQTCSDAKTAAEAQRGRGIF